MVWEYDTDGETIEHRHKSKTGFQKDLYSKWADKPEADYETIERSLFGPIENAGSVALDAIEAKKKLTNKQYIAFVRFVASLHHRTPAMLSRTRDIGTATATEMFKRIAKYSEEYRGRIRAKMEKGGQTEEQIQRMFDSFDKGEWGMAPAHEPVLEVTIASISETAREFHHMQWSFLSVPSGGADLVLGDHPLSFLDASGTQPPKLGYMNPDIQIAVPVSRRIVAIGRWNEPAVHAELSKGVSSDLNDRTFRFAKQFVYAHEKSERIMARAKELKGTGPRIQVERILMPGDVLAIRQTWYQPPEDE